MENAAIQPHAPVFSFQSAKPCGAKTRNGTPCKSPAVHGKNRCRMHGGAAGSGAPLGNKNAFKHGFYTREAVAERGMGRRKIKEILETIAAAKSFRAGI